MINTEFEMIMTHNNKYIKNKQMLFWVCFDEDKTDNAATIVMIKFSGIT